MKTSPIVWILVVLIVLIIIGVIVFFVIKNKTDKEAATEIKSAVSTLPETNTGCTPFSAQQREAIKKEGFAKCSAKLLIPFVGQVYYAACRKSVEANLPPITNC